MIIFEECSDLSVMSWNIENFPKSGHNTIDYASDLINSLGPDIVGLQEMPFHGVHYLSISLVVFLQVCC